MRLVSFTVTAAVVLAWGGPGALGLENPSRQLLGVCVGAEGPTGLLAWATATTFQGTMRAWEVGLTRLDGLGMRPSVRGRAEGPLGWDAVPAAPEFSWRELDDGTHVLWTVEATLTATLPVAGPTPRMGTLAVEMAAGPCDGAAWLPPPAREEPRVLLLAPRASLALAAVHNGVALFMPVTWEPRGLARRAKRQRALPRPEPGGSVRVERTDVAVDVSSGQVVGRAWRIAVLPDGAAGRVVSVGTVVVGDGRVPVVFHRVSGRLELEGGPVDVDGVLLEDLGPR